MWDYVRLFISDHEEIRVRCRRDFLKQESVEFKEKATVCPSQKTLDKAEAFIYVNWEMFKVTVHYFFVFVLLVCVCVCPSSAYVDQKINFHSE